MIIIGRGRRTSIIITAISTIFSLVLVLFSSSPLSAAPLIFAQTETTTSSSGSNLGVGNSNSSNNTMGMMMTVPNLGTPLFTDRTTTINIANITQNISSATFEGNGTFMLPTGTNVSAITSGYRVTNITEGLARAEGHVFIKTMDGTESATLDFTRFTPINSAVGVGVAYVHSAQGQQLASLNNTLMVYKDETISPTEHSSIFWKWE